jgi:hypothetical protein
MMTLTNVQMLSIDKTMLVHRQIFFLKTMKKHEKIFLQNMKPHIFQNEHKNISNIITH